MAVRRQSQVGCVGGGGGGGHGGGCSHISKQTQALSSPHILQGFSRGSSSYRGVTAHPSGRWESRIGIPGSKV